MFICAELLCEAEHVLENQEQLFSVNEYPNPFFFYIYTWSECQSTI